MKSHQLYRGGVRLRKRNHNGERALHQQTETSRYRVQRTLPSINIAVISNSSDCDRNGKNLIHPNEMRIGRREERTTMYIDFIANNFNRVSFVDHRPNTFKVVQ